MSYWEVIRSKCPQPLGPPTPIKYGLACLGDFRWHWHAGFIRVHLCPTNGSLTNGPINSIKVVTMGQLKYLVGNVYPFRWFNAGDFGNNLLQDADVMQVFQSAIYGFNKPPVAAISSMPWIPAEPPM